MNDRRPSPGAGIRTRLQKLIAASGLASRREAERLMVSGRVSVNGAVVTVLGTKVDPEKDDVRVDGQPVKLAMEKIYLKLNKPPSVLATTRDSRQRATVMDLLKGMASTRGSDRVFHVGRLDYASEGLLLLTNDGALANALSHPSNRVPRIYHVRVRGAPSPATLERLLSGLDLEDGLARAANIQLLKRNPRSTWAEVTVVEGRNRLVRRLFDAVGHPVLRLRRVAYGGLELGDLRPGEVRRLTSREVEVLRSWQRGRGGFAQARR